MEADQDLIGDLIEPVTWRHRFVQWLAARLGVRLYAAPMIILNVIPDSPGDDRNLH